MFCTVCFKNIRIVCRICLRMVKKEMDNKNIQKQELNMGQNSGNFSEVIFEKGKGWFGTVEIRGLKDWKGQMGSYR